MPDQDRRAAFLSELLFRGVVYDLWLLPWGREYWYLLASVHPEPPVQEKSVALFFGPLDWLRLRMNTDMWMDESHGTYGWSSLRRAKRRVRDGIEAILRDVGPMRRKRWENSAWSGQWLKVER